MSKTLLKTTGGVTLTPPGSEPLGTINQFYPLNSVDRPNNLAGIALGNGVGSFPVDLNEGLQKSLSQLTIQAEGFLPSIGSLGDTGYRQIFEKRMIPQHKGTLTMTFKRAGRMDESPVTGILTGYTGWNPEMNEVTITAKQCAVTANAYGRYFKFHRFTEAISTIDWRLEIGKQFVHNAHQTLNNLAGIRMWEGSNKMFVNSIAAYDPTDPLAKRITLGANPSTIAAPLSWISLMEAKHQMQNHYETYTTVIGDVVKHDNLRLSPIPGYQSATTYLVILGRNGYRQITDDPIFRDTFVVNGGTSANGILDETLGITSPVFGLKFKLIDNPLTISKETTPKVSTDGTLALEVAYIVGGGISPVGIELSLEGETRIINIGYDDSAKMDPFNLLSITGWMSVVDFSVIQNEALYAIPYDKNASSILAGSIISPADNFKA